MKNEEFATAVVGGERKWSIKSRGKKTLTVLLSAAFFILHSSFFISCSEEDNTEDEFANWQERNDTFFASLQDSLTRGSGTWLRLKSYSLDQSTEGKLTDYIYAKVLQQSAVQTESPKYTDSVRVVYQGRLIPTTTYPDGRVFDGTVYGQYDLSTAATAKFLVSGLTDGYATALQYMHRGDHWRVYIPYSLGYGSSEKTSIPAYSTLIFDITLVDFVSAGNVLPVWKARGQTADEQ